MLTSLDTGLLERLLAATELRAKVIASNIANQNTPGYVRQEVHFEDRLREAVHGPAADLGRVEPEVVEDRLSPASPDGNNVSLETEMTSMRENQLLFETYAAMLEARFELMRLAITESR